MGSEMMACRRHPLRGLCGMLLALNCLVPAAGAADRFDDARAFIRERIASGEIPSAAVAVVEDGKVVWEEGFGLADRERGIAATEHTPYLLASVSKPILTTGIMRLAQEGRLDLDAPANRYLDADARLVAHRGDADAATVRRVANHSAGLPVHYLAIQGGGPQPAVTPAETLRKYGKLLTAPGERYVYSNLGFGVLDRIIERVSGQPVGRYLREQVFEPLGMHHTSFLSPPGDAAAAEYHTDGRRLPPTHFDTPGAGLVYSSAHDLARFAQLHLGTWPEGPPPVLDPAWVEEMRRATPANGSGSPGAPATSRIGWGGVDERPGYRRAVTKAGGMPGAATWMVLVPERGIAAVVLTNVSWSGYDAASYTIADEILKVLLPDWKPLRSEPWEAELEGIGYRPEPQWTGTWTGQVQVPGSTASPISLEFSPAGAVHLRLGDGPRVALQGLKLRDGWFAGEAGAALDAPDARAAGLDHLAFTLKLRGEGRVDGTLFAYSEGILGNGAAYWVELKRSAE